MILLRITVYKRDDEPDEPFALIVETFNDYKGTVGDATFIDTCATQTEVDTLISAYYDEATYPGS